MKTGAPARGRAVVYYRVSTDDQFVAGNGLNAQRDACMAWCAREGLEVVGPFEEDSGVSGATPLGNRDGLAEAVASLRRGDVLLVAKRDRVMRDRVRVAMLEEELKRKGCRLVSASGEGTTDDPDDSSAFLLRAITDVFAEFERLLIRIRTVGAMRARRRRNERNGRVPYGTDLADDGRRSKRSLGTLPIALVPNEGERAGIRLILELRAAGLTYRAIAAELTARGFRAKTGKEFRHSSVAYLWHYHSREQEQHRGPHEGPTARAAPDDAGRPTA